MFGLHLTTGLRLPPLRSAVTEPDTRRPLLMGGAGGVSPDIGPPTPQALTQTAAASEINAAASLPPSIVPTRSLTALSTAPVASGSAVRPEADIPLHRMSHPPPPDSHAPTSRDVSRVM